MLATSPVSNALFEPIIFQLSAYDTADGWIHRNAGNLGVAVAALALLLFREIPHLPIIVVVAGALALEYGPAIIRPCYYRFVPGCLEIIQYCLGGDMVKQIRRIRLRGARVEAREAKGYVSIWPGGTDSNEMRINMPRRRERERFMAALHRAARCTDPSPALPDDELLG